MTTGVCRNARCSIAAAAEIIERYPGPGEYCPECGEALDSADSLPPFGSEAAAPPFLALPKGMLFRRSRLFVASLAAVLVVAVAYAFFRPLTILGRPATGAIQVCRSSITDRLAGDVVRAFATKSGTPPSRFEVVSGGACDMRFSAGIARTDRDAVVGHDGIVVVVNPRNPVTELSLVQIRAILTGAVTDWAEVGGTKGTIVSMAPPDGSDEMELLAATLLYDGKLGEAVRRSNSSAAIVRAVSAPSGRDRVGVVAFSAAVPAKVIKIPSIPAPSTLSIADHRYPFSLSVTVRAESARQDPLLADLLRYARSDAAQELVVRDGLIAKAGF
jgi:hypothetical protein